MHRKAGVTSANIMGHRKSSEKVDFQFKRLIYEQSIQERNNKHIEHRTMTGTSQYFILTKPTAVIHTG